MHTKSMPIKASTLSRRDFMRISAGVTAAAFLAPTLSACTPSEYPTLADSIWKQPFEAPNAPDLYRELVRYATLAPSGHNTQPWKFQVQENTIRIYPDKSRSLAVVDPADREMYISLGAALENLALASAHAGLLAEVALFPSDEAENLRITLTPGEAVKEEELFDAIPVRQCTRRLYNGQPVPPADLEKLRNVTLAGGSALHLFDGAESIEALIGLVKAGNQVQYSDKAFVKELTAWLRFNDQEASRSRDGLFTRCTGNPTVPRWLGEIFLGLSSPDSMTKTDEKNIRSSAGMAVLASSEDHPTAWVTTGRLLQRFLLTATALNIKFAFLNQPIEVPEVREQLANLVGSSAIPQLLIRYGYAERMPVSLRRPVKDVIA